MIPELSWVVVAENRPDDDGVDWENYTIDFGDGDELEFWWEDMRPREIVTKLQEAYRKGLHQGVRAQLDGTREREGK